LSGPPLAAPDQHRPERPILLAVVEQLGEGPALRVAPELRDPLGAHDVSEHEDAEQFGAGSGTEGVEASGFPRPIGRQGQSRLWDWRQVVAWAKVWRREKPWRLL
jgi:hypothetical protein